MIEYLKTPPSRAACAEAVLDLIPTAQQGVFAKEGGELVIDAPVATAFAEPPG